MPSIALLSPILAFHPPFHLRCQHPCRRVPSGFHPPSFHPPITPGAIDAAPGRLGGRGSHHRRNRSVGLECSSRSEHGRTDRPTAPPRIPGSGLNVLCPTRSLKAVEQVQQWRRLPPLHLAPLHFSRVEQWDRSAQNCSPDEHASPLDFSVPDSPRHDQHRDAAMRERLVMNRLLHETR